MTKDRIYTNNNDWYQPTHRVEVTDETGQIKEVHIVTEFPLTIKVNDKEIVTLMTLGTHPEYLILGYLKNQRMIEDYADITSLEVNLRGETASITTREDRVIDLKHKMSRKIVTTGCGEGTVFSCSLDKIYDIRLQPFPIKKSSIYNLLKEIRPLNVIYAAGGSVHTCALCSLDRVLILIEDVGRHNAADSIAGKMWAEDISGSDKLFYTTGRITSEIVIKAALMNIPILISRSGITKMGLDIARNLGMTIIARAKGKRFFVYNNHEMIDFEERGDSLKERDRKSLLFKKHIKMF
ncbi:formate dehydrogenase accessory sulfurtransferase FdhD [Desulforhopalus singaporensis]|uniref:Sulfur carrier protein FdhD n=1 Tax=Desulforhopalus singaporensis TaxID=91360 RepID=A0A1H0V8R3_9BACT|nr:formate dehydrogenase accessory sulfurtransferase FdhD [Desulforhopalus singaporensis]SDP74734.1 FdhD protein [Desulforhopalus singaporensis]